MTKPSQEQAVAQRVSLEQPETQAIAGDFRGELQGLINKHSKENASGTPDFILAAFLDQQLALFEQTITERATWRGESVQLSIGAS